MFVCKSTHTPLAKSMSVSHSSARVHELASEKVQCREVHRDQFILLIARVSDYTNAWLHPHSNLT